MYRDSWLRLQQTTTDLLSYEDRSLYSTWDISYRQIMQQNANSAMLLRLWAYFDNEDLWFELLREGLSAGLPWFRQVANDALGFNEAVRVLCEYGLVEPDMLLRKRSTESRGYGMHGCVHMWTMHALNESRDVAMTQLAMRCVGSHVPARTERDYWVVQRRLMRHADRCLAMHTTGGILVAEGEEWIHGSLGGLYLDQGRLREAEIMYDRALKDKEKAFGPDHTSTLNTVNSLGSLYSKRDRLREAEAMYDRALRIKKKAFDPEHVDARHG
jgi:tetratricopeptide (TPR) repeat protein